MSRFFFPFVRRFRFTLLIISYAFDHIVAEGLILFIFIICIYFEFSSSFTKSKTVRLRILPESSRNSTSCRPKTSRQVSAIPGGSLSYDSASRFFRFILSRLYRIEISLLIHDFAPARIVILLVSDN